MKKFIFILSILLILTSFILSKNSYAQHCTPTAKTCGPCLDAAGKTVTDCTSGKSTCTDGCESWIVECNIHNVCGCTDGPKTCTSCSSQCGSGTKTCSKCGTGSARCLSTCLTWTENCNNTCLVTVSGLLYEDYGNSVCNANIGFNSSYSSLKLYRNLCTVYPEEVTSQNKKSSYTCIANVPDPKQNMQIYADNLIMYSNVEFKDSCAATGSATIQANIPTESLTQNINKDLYFNASDVKWFKLANTSFISYNTYARAVNMPEMINKFKDDDPDDTLDKFLIIGDAGLVSSKSFIQSISMTKYSTNDYRIMNYSFSNAYNDYTNFFGNVTAQGKKYITLPNNISDWNISSGTNSPSILIYESNLVIDDTVFSKLSAGGRPLVLYVKGDIYFNTSSNTFKPLNSTAIYANKINFFNSSGNPEDSGLITEANGLFVANAISAGKSTNKGLKITGNVNLLGTIIDMSERKNSSSQRPALFVVFNPKIMLDLLPLISNSIYEWKEI